MTDLEALQAIEYLVSKDEGALKLEEALDVISDVYRVVHSHLEMHSCHYVHTHWRAKAEEIFKAAKVAGFVA